MIRPWLIWKSMPSPMRLPSRVSVEEGFFVCLILTFSWSQIVDIWGEAKSIRGHHNSHHERHSGGPQNTVDSSTGVSQNWPLLWATASVGVERRPHQYAGLLLAPKGAGEIVRGDQVVHEGWPTNQCAEGETPTLCRADGFASESSGRCPSCSAGDDGHLSDSSRGSLWDCQHGRTTSHCHQFLIQWSNRQLIHFTLK